MTPDLQNLLYMLGGNANQDIGYSSGQRYAQSIAGGENVPGMIAPGVSYSMERPEGYTQSPFYNAGPVPVMPSAPTQGNPLTIENQMPFAPAGVTTPERYTPMITNAESLKNLSDLFNANLPNNMGVSFDPFIDGEPMAIDDLQPTLFDIPFTPPANNLPSTGSSPIDFSFNPFGGSSMGGLSMPSTEEIQGLNSQETGQPVNVDFSRNPDTGFYNIINPDATGIAMYTNDPRKFTGLQATYDEYSNLYDTLQDRFEIESRAKISYTPEQRALHKEQEARFKELYNNFGVLGTGQAYTGQDNNERTLDVNVYDRLFADKPTIPQITPNTTLPSGINVPSIPLNIPMPTTGNRLDGLPYAPVEIDPIPQPVDVPVDPMPTYFVPETPVVSLQDLPTSPVGMPFIPNEPMPPVAVQDYNDKLIREILDPVSTSLPTPDFGGYNNVRGFLR